MHIVLITDLELDRTTGTGIWVYVKNFIEQCPHKITVIGKNKSSGTLGADHYIEIQGANANALYLIRLYQMNESKIPKDAILVAQRPDLLGAFRHLSNQKYVMIHGNPSQVIRQKKGFFMHLLYRIVEAKGIGAAEKVIFIDSQAEKEYKKRYHIKRSVIIPPGYDQKIFHPQVLETSNILLYIGRLEEEKNVDQIIQATKDSNYKLTIIGSGRKEEELKAIQADHATFIDAVKQEQLPEYINKAHAVVLLSSSEGVPTVAIESMACGTPVLATAVGDLPNIIEDGKNGFIVNKKTLLEKADQVNKKEMREHCLQTAKRFDWKEIYLKIEEYLFS